MRLLVVTDNGWKENWRLTGEKLAALESAVEAASIQAVLRT